MKHQLIVLLLLIAVIKHSPAQITFQKGKGSFNNFSKPFRSVHQTADGGFILLSNESFFFYIDKADANGNGQWRKSISGQTVIATVGSSIRQTADGGYIVTGIQAYNNGNTNTDVLLIKTDANGDTTWAKRYGGANNSGRSVEQTADGGYIITGETQTATDTNVYALKTNAIGNVTWAKTYGGSAKESGNAVKQTSDGGYIIAGQSNSFGAGNGDCYLIKTDANGDTLWTKAFGGTNADIAYAVEQTTDGGYIIAAETGSFGSGGKDAYLIKTDSSGTLLWSKCYGSSGNETAVSAQQTTDGGYVFTGGSGIIPGAYLVKTNNNGDTLWTKSIGSSYQAGYSVQQTADGGYVVGGSAFVLNTPGGFFSKTDSNGSSGCDSATVTIVTIPATIQTSTTTTVTSLAAVTTAPTISVSASSNTFLNLCTPTGISDTEYETDFSIYPNPANKLVIINLPAGQAGWQFAENKNAEIKIFDVMGKEVLKSEIRNEKTEIDVSKFENGIYFAQIVSSNAIQKISVTKKLIIN